MLGALRRSSLEFGSFRPLLIRAERLDLGFGRRQRVLYASDLHLGHWWTRRVPRRLVDAVNASRPDVVLLGGDLSDNDNGLEPLSECVAELVRFAPLLAVAGNHDLRPGVERVRAAVVTAGGHWLADHSVRSPLLIDAVVAPGDRSRVLCAHYPSVFPAAMRAGYGLVLAGHLHGGQCVLATVRDRLYPAVWFQRWHVLRFRQDDTTMYVSRGAADTLPIRFNCPREVIVCTLT